VSIYIDGGDFIGRMIKLAGEWEVESRHPFWDANLESRYQRDQQDRANARVDWEHNE
jgi:hypothetical protein